VHLVSIARTPRRRSTDDPHERHYVRTDLTLPAETALDVVEQMLQHEDRILFLVETNPGGDPGEARSPHASVRIFSSDNVIHGTHYENQLIDHFIDALLAPTKTEESAGANTIGLSAREISLVEGLAAGRSGKQIALDLGLSHSTIKSLRTRLYQKLAVTNSAGAVAKIMRDGYVMPINLAAVPIAE
jgi:DNA-binding NarL/FixJ family response regulator